MDRIIEIAHQRGNCPDRFYYQVNGKSPQENFIAHRHKLREKVREQAEIQNYIEKELPKQVEEELRKAFKEIMR